jgi:hypothetical protein
VMGGLFLAKHLVGPASMWRSGAATRPATNP